MDPIRIDVRASRPYTVYIGGGLLSRAGGLLDTAGVVGRRVVVSSPTVWELHGAAVAAALPDGESILIPDGERSKQLQTVSRIYEALVRLEADRQTVVVAFGGGVIGDVAGFAAATYLRGVQLVQVPTTLLAQVDSAIGGKVGVNHPLGKNLIGAFHAPRAVIVDPLLLGTLPRREFRAGLYEVVKYGVIASRPLFDTLQQGLPSLFGRDPATLAPVIAESCRIKAEVVSADEREQGARRRLNFGHTIGHALEAVTKYRRYRHGEAIAYGMLAAAELAVARRALAMSDRDALAGLIAQMGPLPPIADLSASQVLEAIRHDKKIIAGKLHFVLPTAVGVTTIVDDVTERELERALATVGMRA